MESQFINCSAKSGRVSIIVGDINDDKEPDIIFMRENTEDGSDIFAFHSDGTLIDGWPYSFDKANNLRSSPTLTDIDKDGDLELIFSYSYVKSSPNPSSYTIDILDLNSIYNPLYQKNLYLNHLLLDLLLLVFFLLFFLYSMLVFDSLQF